MYNDSATWQFIYNADGLRTKRTNGTTTYSYVYNGDSLSQMTVGSNTLYFTYDASGTPLTVTYNGTTYYYVTNIQGDVVALLNSTGTAVVKYTYDAWGNILTTIGTMASTLGVHNPLRYRGYVYDNETGLYYLQSRYYDPEMGRFINVDAFVSTGTGLLGNNMFAYCNNNPIRFSDPTGHAIWGTNTVAICDGGTGDGKGTNPSAHKSHTDIPAEYDDSNFYEIEKGIQSIEDFLAANDKYIDMGIDGLPYGNKIRAGVAKIRKGVTLGFTPIPGLSDDIVAGGYILWGIFQVVTGVSNYGEMFEERL